MGGPDPPPLSPMTPLAKILVVDDDLDVLDQLSLILKSANYAVQTAESQADAEALLASFQPDVAIVDLMLETMDSGFVLAYRIKQRYPRTGVIILTAVTSETGLDFDLDTAAEKQWVKADALLDKPVRAEQIKAEIARLLSLQHAHQG
jgi:CheY-like chemotaxis protein